MKRIISRFLLVAMVLAQSCNVLEIFPIACQEYIPQKYKLGDQTVHIRTSKTVMHVGDTVFAKLRFDQNVYDSLGKKKIVVNGRVKLWLPLQTAMRSSLSTRFEMDTSIQKIFDQYFETVVIAGHQQSTHSFDCVKVGGFWELDIRYVAKKKGVYELYPFLSDLTTNENLPRGVCMLGSPTYDAKVNLAATNNRIGELYPILPLEYENHFGFIVE